MGFSESSDSGRSQGAATAAVAALFLASAYSGYGKTKDCRNAKDELMLRLTRHQPGYLPGYAPATSYPLVPYDPWLTPPPGAFSKPGPPPAPPIPPAPQGPSP